MYPTGAVSDPGRKCETVGKDRRGRCAAGFSLKGFSVPLFFDEGDPLEPIHVHVTKDDADAKFWLQPEVNVAYNKGFNARTLAQLSRVVEERREEIESAWHDHFA